MKKIAAILCVIALLLAFTACGAKPEQPETPAADETAPAEPAADETTPAETATEEPEETAAEPEEPEEPAEPEQPAEPALPDGEYKCAFNTDSSMFHANEACDGMGVLTVKDGKMTIHVSLVSKSILNLYPGKAEDAQKEGAEWLQPTVDEVTYSDGTTEEVFGFDIPVEALDTDFDLALIGKKGVWYDHVVSVSSPETEG